MVICVGRLYRAVWETVVVVVMRVYRYLMIPVVVVVVVERGEF